MYVMEFLSIIIEHRDYFFILNQFIKNFNLFEKNIFFFALHTKCQTLL